MKEANDFKQNKIICATDFTMNVCLDYFNERLKINAYRGNVGSMQKQIKRLGSNQTFSKIMVLSRQEDWKSFLERGYQFEALLPRYFNGSDGYSMAMYTENSRRNSDYWAFEDDTLQQVKELPCSVETTNATGYTYRVAESKDAVMLAKLYQTVFEIYPTPMNDPEYIQSKLKGDVIFYVSEYDGEIVSAASAEINPLFHNAELTDCATLPAHRKNGLMKVLIAKLEEALISNQIFCVYSIARALSFGINAVFHQRYYTYTGRLTKNCNIYNKLEDMNLWVRDLSQPNG